MEEFLSVQPINQISVNFTLLGRVDAILGHQDAISVFFINTLSYNKYFTPLALLTPPRQYHPSLSVTGLLLIVSFTLHDATFLSGTSELLPAMSTHLCKKNTIFLVANGKVTNRAISSST